MSSDSSALRAAGIDVWTATMVRVASSQYEKATEWAPVTDD
jgi:hypothetical protein